MLTALAVGAGLPGCQLRRRFAGASGEVPRAADRARSRQAAAGSHRRLGETDRAVRVASLARGARSSPLMGAGRVGRDLEFDRPRTPDRRDVCGQDVADPARSGAARGRRHAAGRVESKAALDIDWSDPTAQTAALAPPLAEVDRLERWVARACADRRSPAVATALTSPAARAHAGLGPDPATGQPRIRRASRAIGCPRSAMRRCAMAGRRAPNRSPVTGGMSSNSSMPI